MTQSAKTTVTPDQLGRIEQFIDTLSEDQLRVCLSVAGERLAGTSTADYQLLSRDGHPALVVVASNEQAVKVLCASLNEYSSRNTESLTLTPARSPLARSVRRIARWWNGPTTEDMLEAMGLHLCQYCEVPLRSQAVSPIGPSNPSAYCPACARVFAFPNLKGRYQKQR